MKLLLCTPCEKVLQDANSGPSLIALFHNIKVSLPPEAPEVPSNAVIPKEWAIYSKFGLEPKEEGKNYSLLTEVFWPDGTLFFNFDLQSAHQVKQDLPFVVRMQGFPIGQNGELKICQTVKSEGKAVCGPFATTLTVIVERAPFQGTVVNQ